MVCSYECTFCCDGVVNVLSNVCTNCSPCFTPGPIGPDVAGCEGVSLAFHAASEQPELGDKSIEQMTAFAIQDKHIPPYQR